MKVRKAAFANQFYPFQKKEFIKLYEQILLSEKNKLNYDLAASGIIGAVLPHAGMMYSGYQAIHFFELLKNHPGKFDTIIIVNPNHTGYGEDISLDENFSWQSVFGDTLIDLEFNQELGFPQNEMAHRFEHSGEIMLPFLQYVLDYPFKILPITLTTQNLDYAKLIAKTIFETNQRLKKEILFIASSDFSHFVGPEQGIKQDNPVVDAILKFDSESIEKECNKTNLSICGYGPIMSLIEYSKLLNQEVKVQKLRRGHSGEVNRSSEVVHYMSMLFYTT